MQTLGGIPRHIGNGGTGRFAPELTPRFLLLEVPNDDGAVAGGGGQDVWNLWIPADLKRS